MNPRLLFMTLTLGATLTLGVQAGASEQDLVSARPVIEKANSDWVPALQAADIDRATEPYDENAVWVLPDGKTYKGKTEIKNFLRERVSSGSKITGGTIQQDGISSIRDGLIYEWGHGGTTKVDAKGESHTSSGQYLTIWQRDKAGKWQISRNLNF